MPLKLQLVTLAWDGVSGSQGYDILLDGVKVANTGPKARTTRITIPEGGEHRVTIRAVPSGNLQEAHFSWGSGAPLPPNVARSTPTGVVS